MITRRASAVLRIVLGSLAVLLPGAAMACPMCYGSSSPRVLLFYYLTAALLTVLPFGIVGGIILVTSRMMRQARDREAAADAAEI